MPVTRRSRLEKCRDETRPSRSRLVLSLCFARRSRKIFFVSGPKKPPQKRKNGVFEFCQKVFMYWSRILSRLVTFGLEMGRTRPSRVSSRLVTFVSLPALLYIPNLLPCGLPRSPFLPPPRPPQGAQGSSWPLLLLLLLRFPLRPSLCWQRCFWSSAS